MYDFTLAMWAVRAQKAPTDLSLWERIIGKVAFTSYSPARINLSRLHQASGCEASYRIHSDDTLLNMQHTLSTAGRRSHIAPILCMLQGVLPGLLPAFQPQAGLFRHSSCPRGVSCRPEHLSGAGRALQCTEGAEEASLLPWQGVHGDRCGVPGLLRGHARGSLRWRPSHIQLVRLTSLLSQGLCHGIL